MSARRRNPPAPPAGPREDDLTQREESLQAVASQLFHGLPKVLAAVLKQALDGNLAAAKIVFDVAGLRDAIQSPESADSTQDVLDASIVQRLREQMEALPDKPDPLTFKW